MRNLFLVVIVATCLGFAFIISTSSPALTVSIAAAVILAPVVLKDYRFGVVILSFLLPVSFAFPVVKGFSPVDLLNAATLSGFAVQRVFGRHPIVWPPKVLFLCFLLPITVSILLALPHTSEISRNYPIEAVGLVTPFRYFRDRYLLPVLNFVGFSFLLSNTVQDSKSKERFILLFGLCAIAPAVIVIWTAFAYPGTFAQLVADREFMTRTGMHANEFGVSLALASGPLLFSVSAATSTRQKWFYRLILTIVTLGLILTFSRGPLLAYAVTVIGYLLFKARLKTVVVACLIISVALLVSPDAVTDRLARGFGAEALSDATAGDIKKDELTAGRVRGWVLLAPEVLKSPVYGSGMGSTQWSSAVSRGLFIPTHPHNMYLEILLDMGLMGLLGFVFLFYSYLRKLSQICKGTSITSGLVGFFHGTRMSIFGLFVLSMTAGLYMPNSAQFSLWFSLGLLFANWNHRDSTVQQVDGRDASRMSDYRGRVTNAS